MNNISVVVSKIGTLRFLLQSFATVCIILSQFAGNKAVLTGWEMLPTLIVPAVIPIVFFGMLLELLMSTVFMFDAEEAEQKNRFRTIIKIDLFIVAGLLLFWVPVFTRLMK